MEIQAQSTQACWLTFPVSRGGGLGGGGGWEGVVALDLVVAHQEVTDRALAAGVHGVLLQVAVWLRKVYILFTPGQNTQVFKVMIQIVEKFGKVYRLLASVLKY